jgi:hypothetical protein
VGIQERAHVPEAGAETHLRLVEYGRQSGASLAASILQTSLATHMENAESVDIALSRLSWRKYLFTISPPYILNSISICILLLKLQYQCKLHWSAFFAPIWLADIWTMMIKLKLLVYSEYPYGHHRLYRATEDIIDSCGYFFTKAAIYLYLDDKILHGKVTISSLCIPLWACTLISIYMRCQFSADSQFSILLGSMYHITCRVLQPVLVVFQLDGILSQPWMVVFTPTWTVLVLCFSGSLFLIYCAPIIRLHALERLQYQATILIFLCCMYLLCISCCGFLFILW